MYKNFVYVIYRNGWNPWFYAVFGINNNINKLFTLALSGWFLQKIKFFWKICEKGLTNVYTSDIIYTEVEGNNQKKEMR